MPSKDPISKYKLGGKIEMSRYQQPAIRYVHRVLRQSELLQEYPDALCFVYMTGPVEAPEMHFLLSFGDQEVPMPVFHKWMTLAARTYPGNVRDRRHFAFPPAWKASDPETKPEWLLELAWFYPNEVLRNPLLQLLFMQDLEMARAIAVRCAFALSDKMPSVGPLTDAEQAAIASNEKFVPVLASFCKLSSTVCALRSLPFDSADFFLPNENYIKSIGTSGSLKNAYVCQCTAGYAGAAEWRKLETEVGEDGRFQARMVHPFDAGSMLSDLKRALADRLAGVCYVKFVHRAGVAANLLVSATNRRFRQCCSSETSFRAGARMPVLRVR